MVRHHAMKGSKLLNWRWKC